LASQQAWSLVISICSWMGFFWHDMVSASMNSAAAACFNNLMIFPLP
jgi:hypothetical protein